MSDDVWQTIADAIERGDGDAVVAALEALDESTRRRLSTRAKRAAKQAGEDRWPRRRLRTVAADAAVFGTAGSAAAARMWWWSPTEDLRERLIRSRPREWRQDWAERVMTDTEVATWHWKVVHRLVKDGQIDRPVGAGYVSGAIAGMYEWPEQREGARPVSKPLVETLRGEQEWLRHDLWRLFEVEDASPSSRDVRPQSETQSWQEALCQLAAEGTIPRDRLLDETLAALRRDFSPFNARWYRELHEALEPTEAEHVARLDELLALLAASDPAVVGFSLRALDKLERRKVLPGDSVLEAIAPALLLPVKAHATRAVKLVGRVLKRDPSYARVALPALVQALGHESRDMQELVLALVERHDGALSDDDRARLAALGPDIDPAVRGRVEALAYRDGGGVESAGEGIAVASGPAVAVPPRRMPDPNAPRLSAPPLSPPADVEELFDRIAVAVERADDPEEIELLLDGISRLRDGAVDQGRARAVLERCTTISPIWNGRAGFDHARDALGVAIVRWLGGREYRRAQLGRTGRSPREAIAIRVRELVDDLPGRKPRRLLSTPTHPGGWIDPHEAVRRVAELEGWRPPEMDLAQMVLRLAPDDRAGAREAAAQLAGEAAAVLVHALGGTSKRPLLSKFKLAWTAAAQACDPAGFELPRRPLKDHEALRASWFRQEVVKVDPASPADLLVLEESWWGWEPSGLERWLTRVWPANREGVFDLVARRLWVNTGTREYGIEDVLEVLLEPTEPIGNRAALAIGLALGSADITHRALAVDVAIAGLRSRRLDGETLGAQLVLMLREQETAVPARWAASLGDVAAGGPLCAHDVQIAIEAILTAADAADRRRLLGLVDLLRRLAVEADAAVTIPGAREWLSSLGSGSKIGRAGKEALAVTGEGAARSRAAAAQAQSP